MKSSMTKLAIALAAMVVGGSAAAGPVTTTFTVTASVGSECVIGNPTNMAFGALKMLDGVSGGLNEEDNVATATFDATCTNGTALPKLQFSSANGVGTFKMKGGISDDLMSYSLYTGGEPEQITHDTAAAFPGFEADGTVKTLTVSGRLTAGDKASKTIGAYTDTVTITATFTPD
ncbi:spore coat protein U domain-containing protein [Caenimonas sp. SL110]|uniref:spore coat protein U domain-containing protein n=1 Tax=Caenimonas sp. SL110 TaxID=1450524 RepID=UPI0006547D72|nr:spore coat protein U domain-containing protein [Caenimonas sp. SL110]